jgi:hypothetical protein
VSRFPQAIESVTKPKEDIRQSIRNPDIAWLLSTSACERCASFLAECATVDVKDTDPQLRRYEAGEVLLILVAMEAGNGHDVLEALRLLGTRSVDARGSMPEKRRYRKAGEARLRPVTDARHYERVHLPQMRQRLTSELHALVTRSDRLEAALTANGITAKTAYL